MESKYKVSDLKSLSQTGSHGYTRFECHQLSSIQDLDTYSTKYPYIENLDISQNKLTTIENVASFKQLKWLNVANNKLSKFDLNVAWNIDTNTGNKSLLELNVSHNIITNLGCISKHSYIEVLDLSHNRLQSIDELSALHCLKTLNIEQNKITDLSPLNALEITTLNASHNKINKIDNIHGKSIKILNVNSNQISNLNCTRNFEQLTEFHCAKNQISDFYQLQNLTKLPLLRDLDIRDNPINYKNIDCEQDLELEILYILSNLEYLNGDKADSKTKIESVYKHNKYKDTLASIKKYYLNDQDVKITENEDQFWYRIVEGGFAICWEKFINKFPILSAITIDLTNIKIGNVGLHAIGDAIEECQNLTNLVLSNCLTANRWTDTKYKWPLKYLCDTLLINDTLKLLDLSNCCIDSLKFEPISYLIANSKSLNTLNLNHNEICQHTLDENLINMVEPCPAIKQLTESILKSESLINLFINHNEIDSFGAYLIGKCLQNEQCRLEQIDLSYNPLSVAGNGFAEVSKSIKVNECLTVLDLSYCIEDESNSYFMEQVFHSLKENKGLQNFDISGNVLSTNAMKYLLLALQQNKTIQSLGIRDICIEKQTFKAMESILSSNNNDFSEISIDIQSTDNIQTILHSLSNHANLKALYLSNMKQQSAINNHFALNTDEIQTILSRLIVLHLDKLCLSSKYISQILISLIQSNEDLIDLNLESAELDKECSELLETLCNKVSLQKLNLNGCTINADNDILIKFFQSRSVLRSLIELNMGKVNWMNVELLTMFQKLYKALKNQKNRMKSRQFTLNLTELPIHEKSIINNSDCIRHLMGALSNIGVTTLILDEFIMINDNYSVTEFDVINEIFHCFAQRPFNIKSLSLKQELNCGTDSIQKDDLMFIAKINSVKLHHIALPKINNNKEALNALLSELRNSNLRSVELGNDINQQMMNLISKSIHEHDYFPKIEPRKFMNIGSEKMDYAVNDYMSHIAFVKCCKM